MDVKIKIDTRALEKVLGSLSPKNTRKVMRKGLKVAAKSAKKQSVKVISDEYNLKKKDVAVGVRVKEPRGSNGDYSSVTLTPIPIGLERFKPRQVKKGLSVKVSRKRGKETLPHAFNAKVKGKSLSFVRTRAITTATSKYVIYPSKKSTRRSKTGSELPINRLLADPASEIVRPQADKIGQTAADEAAIQMIVDTENLLDRGLA